MTPTPLQDWISELERRKAALVAMMEGLSGVALEEAEMELAFILHEIERFLSDFQNDTPDHTDNRPDAT